MSDRPSRLAMGVLLAVLGGGCVPLKRTPQARFFALRGVARPAAATASTATAGTVGLAAVRLPGFLERPQIVTWMASGELRLHEFDRWAEPLDQGAGRVLAENLAALLPAHRILRQPWPALSPLTSRVGVEIARFGVDESGKAELTGRYVVLPAASDNPLETGSFRLERKVPGASGSQSPEAIVTAMSELVGELAATLGEAVKRHPQVGQAAAEKS